jgi:hypothetical protein
MDWRKIEVLIERLLSMAKDEIMVKDGKLGSQNLLANSQTAVWGYTWPNASW